MVLSFNPNRLILTQGQGNSMGAAAERVITPTLSAGQRTGIHYFWLNCSEANGWHFRSGTTERSFGGASASISAGIPAVLPFSPFPWHLGTVFEDSESPYLGAIRLISESTTSPPSNFRWFCIYAIYGPADLTVINL